MPVADRHLSLDRFGSAAAGSTAVVVQSGDSWRWTASRDSALVLKRALAEIGIRAIVVRSGPKALDELVAVKPDLVILATLDITTADGSLQDLLEAARFNVVGSPAMTARLAADKALTKAALQRAGVAVPLGRLVSNTATRFGPRRMLEELQRELGPAVVVKPVHGAVSTGLRLVSGDRLAEAVLGALNHDGAVLVERYLPGPEFCVLVDTTPAGGHAVAACQVENERLTDPYHPARTKRLTSVITDAPGFGAAVTIAREATTALGCRDLATVDIALDADGQPAVIDVDIDLDLSYGGKIATLALQAGVTVDDLIARIVARHLAADSDRTAA